MNGISEFSFPTRIVVGAGAVSLLGRYVREMGGQRVQLVTDDGLVRAGLADRIRTHIIDSGLTCGVFDQVSPNPTEQNVRDGLAHFRNNDCDMIVSLGGGSATDAAKAIRVCATHELPLHEYVTERQGWMKITRNLPAMIAIPTTSGTGSEVGRGAVITMESTSRKALIFSPHLIPSIALCDPELTVRLPYNLTAWTGSDALTHNIESYLSNVYHPICEGIALHGVRLCFQHLPRAVVEGENIEARQGMMMASMMGAIAFQKELGATHSLAHPLSVHYGLNHGLANAIMLPHVLIFNRPVVAPLMRDLAQVVGIDVSGLDENEAADAFIGAVDSLLRQINIPRSLSEFGVRQEAIEILASDAMADPCHQFNPRPCTLDDFRDLYRLGIED